MMDLHEYQGKELFRSVGLATPRGLVADDPDQAAEAVAELGEKVVVKAQVHAGGRGKAGGVKVAEGADAVRSAAQEILGMEIKGHTVRRLLIEEASQIEKEMYASLILDRGAKKVLAMFSPLGGMDVEEISRTRPDALAQVHVDPLAGWSDYHARRLAFESGLEKEVVRPLGGVFARLWRAFTQYEAMLTEINPLILTASGELVALDSKFTVDGNSLYRHGDIVEMRDVEASDPQEQMAHEKGVTYVKLDGSIGVLGNGAGLVMSTLDVVADAGGSPANFLDVGGGAKAEEIVDALEVITSDAKVQTIFFNIFGGITRCDEVARGVLTAVEKMGIEMPIVVRLDGTNEEEGRSILAEAGPANLHAEETMLSAARRAVQFAESAAPGKE